MSDADRGELLRDLRHALLDLVADGMDYLPRPDPRRSAAPSEAGEPAGRSSEPPVVASAAPSSATQPHAEDALGLIRADLGDCTRCRLHEGRRQIVFGEGSPHAPVVFVGEGPGAEEDRTGRPFVGRAGELLTRMINAVGWERDDVYICNIVKCRPPGNRDPQLDEVATCRTFLERQLGAIHPHVIVTLGKPAASTLLGRPVAITRARGTWQEWNGIPLMPTFHPAYLLRNYTRQARQAVWDDLQAVRARVDDETAG